MTNQEKKAWLRRYCDNEQEIRRAKEEILRWESLAEKITTSYGADIEKRQSDRIQIAVEKIAEWKNTLASRIENHVLLAQEINQAIDAISEDNLKLVLRYRYINGWAFEQIARKMNYSCAQVYRFHVQAISKMIVNDSSPCVIL